MLGIRSVINTRHWDFSCPAAALVDAILSKVHTVTLERILERERDRETER